MGEVAAAIRTPESPEPTPELLLEVDAATHASFAAEQCGIPIVRELRLAWRGARPLEGAVVSLSIEPGLAPLRALPLPTIAAGATLVVQNPDLALDGARLRAVSRREVGSLVVTVAAGARTLARLERPLEVLAADEWDGTALAELAAAFVLPDDPAVVELLRRARPHRLRNAGGVEPAGDARRDPAHVLATVEAIYAAVQELALELDVARPTGAVGPQSRRVRSPSAILAQRTANDFDLTLLFAAALEAAGLHAWIVLLAGHALPAVWCDGDHLSVASTDDPGVVAKLLAAGRIAVFEATSACGATSWRAATDAARARLDDRDAFELAIDVKAARLAQIRPLPITGARTADAPPPTARDADPVGSTAPVADGAAAHARTRVDRWKEQLLDLSLRNRLLNYVPSRSRTLALDLPALADFEDRLHARPLVPVAEVLLAGDDPRADALVQGRVPEAERRQRLRERLERGDLPTRHRPAELHHRLVTIWREARREIEETGASTLELALGMLRWPAIGRSSPPDREVGCLAPILLLPVELVRRGAGMVFELRLRDDEPRVNETLLEKLRTEFEVVVPGLDPLPTDDHGIDVAAVLQAFQRALAVRRGFDVVEEAHVGFFSFAKFLLWRDLAAHEQELLRHDLVHHLVHGDRGAALGVNAPFTDARALDRERPPESSRLVLDADGSQRVAIDAALRGRSFVLQGPPGTGKSQTIANLIAECLAAGKRVLFVAEKRAALEVVARRLERVGLGDLCLELHSQKASKRELVNELAGLLEPPAQAPPSRPELAQEVSDLAAALTAHADGLHAASALGPSHFACVERRLELADAPRVAADWGDVVGCDAATFTRRAQALARVAEAAAPIADPAQSPWRACRPVDWTPLVQQSVEQALARFAAATERLAAAVAPLAQALGVAVELPLAAVAGLREVAALLGTAIFAKGPPVGAWPLVERSGDDGEAALARVESDAALASELAERAKRVALHFGEGLDRLELEPLRAAFARHAGRLAPLRWFALRGPRRMLASVAKDAGAPLAEPATLIETLTDALRVQALRRDLDAEQPFLAELFGAAAAGARSDAVTLRAAASFARRWRAAAAEFHSRAAVSPKTRALEPAEATRLGRELDAAEAEFTGLRAPLQELLRFDEGAFHATAALATAADVARVVAGWRGALPLLRDWTRFATSRATAEGVGLRPFLEAALRDGVTASQWPAAAERSFLDAWLVRSLDGRAELRGFDARDHERRIASFRAADRAWIAQNGPQLAHALRRAAAPATGAVAVPESEVGLLKRQSLLKRRHLAIRRLLAELPNLLPRLKPCLLMSPLSIAQYLPPSGRLFDVVVFDEASQITVPDAIGAVARGKQVVVVGDSRQLPPTSFFATQVGDDEAEAGESELPGGEEVESILDECVAANLPQLTLRWHYRSRHEQLIEFSNRHYYEGRLATFPSAWTDRARFGVSLQRVAGVFDRARSRTNRAEAEAVVAWIVAALRDPDRRARSIGVVTFNAPQRELILDLLDAARRAHPEIEPCFSDTAPEPVFVKNLENVQGDERDVMLFSITYGPDPRGRVLMNFGPLNAAGGERRLNVAITRAREQLVVFSSLAAGAIDPSRTRALGVDHLRRFLHAAEKGERGSSAGASADRSERVRHGVGPLASAVARALERDGLQVDGGVGASRLCVDLALKDASADHYVAGLLCDGASYYAAETARDRDRLRDSVLESLGWRLAHVWSTEWIVDPERELARVRERVAALRRAAPPAAAAGANAAIVDAPPPASNAKVDANARVRANSNANANAARRDDGDGDANVPGRWTPYVPPAEPPRTPEQLGDPESAATLLATIVRAEGPLHEEPAFRTLAGLHRIVRLTPAVATECAAVAAAAERQGVVTRRGEFLWPPDVDPDDPPLRGPAADGRVRHAPHVPPEERAAAAARVLAANVALPRAELARSAARLLGFARATDRVVAAFDEGVQRLLDEGRAIAEGERVRLP